MIDESTVLDAVLIDANRIVAHIARASADFKVLILERTTCGLMFEATLKASGSISEWNGGFAVSYVEPALGVQVFDRTGKIVNDLQPLPLDSAVRQRLGERPVALPTILLDSTSLQVVADPFSERRLLVLRDARGRIVRSEELAVLWAPREADPHTQHLLVLAGGVNGEALVYRWRWGRRRDLSPEEVPK